MMTKYARGIRSLKASEKFLTTLLSEVSNPRMRDIVAATINGLRRACEAAERVEQEQKEVKHAKA